MFSNLYIPATIYLQAAYCSTLICQVETFNSLIKIKELTLKPFSFWILKLNSLAATNAKYLTKVLGNSSAH